MKFYTIVESFSPSNGEAWISYCQWRGVQFERFDSIDGMLRPSLFRPTVEEDFRHLAYESGQRDFINDFSYALGKYLEMGAAELVGVKFDEHHVDDEEFCGFDIIDRDGHSLLANWGNDLEFITSSLASNALVREWDRVQGVFQQLLEGYSDDPHVANCRVVSIYKTLVRSGG